MIVMNNKTKLYNVQQEAQSALLLAITWAMSFILALGTEDEGNSVITIRQ